MRYLIILVMPENFQNLMKKMLTKGLKSKKATKELSFFWIKYGLFE